MSMAVGTSYREPMFAKMLAAIVIRIDRKWVPIMRGQVDSRVTLQR